LTSTASVAAGGAHRVFVDGAAEAIAAIGTRHFWPRLAAMYGRLVDFHGCVVFRYRRHLKPAFVFGNLDSKVARNEFREYRDKAYLLDPFYEAFRARIPDGVVKLRDVGADRFFRSVYYRQYYEKTGLGDEIGLFCWTGGRELIVLSLVRRSDAPLFRKAELAEVRATVPAAAAMIKLNERMIAAAAAKAATGPVRLRPHGNAAATELFHLPSAPLTSRERVVAEMILKGHSSLSMSLALGISVETVKVHRRHLYRKLQVTSQAELFALAMRPG